MNVFDPRNRLADDYASDTRSFIKIKDQRTHEEVESALQSGTRWPAPLLQLNPTFLTGGTVDDLVKQEIFHPECQRVFRFDKTNAAPLGKELMLHTHQPEAISRAKENKSFFAHQWHGTRNESHVHRSRR